MRSARRRRHENATRPTAKHEHRDLFDLLQHTADGAFAVDSEQRIIFWNKAAEQLLGWPAAEVVGRYCREIICGADESRRAVCGGGCAEMTLATKEEPIPAHNLITRTRVGREVCLNVSLVVAAPTSRNDLPLIHMFRDVTEQQQILRLAKHALASIGERHRPADGIPTGSNELSGSPAELTRREQVVLRHLASGTSTAALARLLCVSPHTVRNHVKAILGKLGVHSRVEAISRAYRDGLLLGSYAGGASPVGLEK